MQLISRVIVHERALAVSTGREQMLALVEEHLRWLDGDPVPRPLDSGS